MKAISKFCETSDDTYMSRKQQPNENIKNQWIFSLKMCLKEHLICKLWKNIITRKLQKHKLNEAKLIDFSWKNSHQKSRRHDLVNFVNMVKSYLPYLIWLDKKSKRFNILKSIMRILWTWKNSILFRYVIILTVSRNFF